METALCSQNVAFLFRVGHANDRPASELGLLGHQQCLLVDFRNHSILRANYEAVVEEGVYRVDATSVELVNWAYLAVACCADCHDYDVTMAGTSVQKGVIFVDCKTCEESFIVSKLAIKPREFMTGFIKAPKLDCAIVGGNKSVPSGVVEADIRGFLVLLIGC